MCIISVVLMTVIVVTGVGVIVSRILYKQRGECRYHEVKLPSGGSSVCHDGGSVSHDDFNRFGFPDTYRASGIIHLPLDDIHEPFHAWYSGKHHMSRVDYYYGKLTKRSARTICRYHPCHTTHIPSRI